MNSFETEDSSSQPSELRAIWNPSAVANWSLLLTPVFGAYLQMVNWKILGETERAKSAKRWFYTIIIIKIIVDFIYLLSSRNRINIDLTLLFFWYFSSGRTQIKYVKAKYDNNYPRKPIGKALLSAVGIIICYFLALSIISLFVHFINISR